tara:strand:+ start:324 stop:425 length:102 start_codon:yes stop_codon:yes gene_type:complete
MVHPDVLKEVIGIIEGELRKKEFRKLIYQVQAK